MSKPIGTDDLVKRLRKFDWVLHELEIVDQAADRIEQLAATNEELEAELKEEIRISNKRGNMIEFDLLPKMHEAEAVLREVDTWVDDLGMYAQEGHEPATVFKRVKEVLNK